MAKSKMSIARKKKAGSRLPKPVRASKHLKVKKAVSEYMQKHRKVWISELAEELELDLGTLIPVLEELYQEGHIKRLKA